jgi:hypothetical protein
MQLEDAELWIAKLQRMQVQLKKRVVDPTDGILLSQILDSMPVEYDHVAIYWAVQVDTTVLNVCILLKDKF